MTTSAMRIYIAAWGALWFLVVVVFIAGVGIIATATTTGHMPPLTHGGIQAVVDEQADDPSSAPSPGAVRLG